MPRSLLALATALVALAPPAAAAAQPSAPFTFDQASPGYDFGAGMAAAPDGTTFLVTSEAQGDAGVKAIRVAALRSGDSIHAARLVRRITAPSGRTFFEPRIAVNGNVATVAWTRQHRGGELRVQAVRCTVSGCGAVQTLGRAQRIKTRATPAVDRKGRSFVLWRGTSSKGPRLQWAISTRGHFGRPHTLGSFGQDLAVAAEPDGTFAVAWNDPAGLRFAERRAGREMSSPQRLSGGYPVAESQLVAAGRELIAAWRTGGDDGEGQPGAGAVTVALRSAGGRRFHSQRIVFAGHGRNLRLAADPAGRAVLAFADAGPQPESAFVAPTYAALREAGAKAFGAPALLDAQTPLYLRPAAAVDAAGTATVAWTRLQPNGAQPGMVLAAGAAQNAGFGASQTLGTASGAPLAAAGGTVTTVAWDDGANWLATTR